MLRRLIAASLATLLPFAAIAQTPPVVPTYRDAAGNLQQGVGVYGLGGSGTGGGSGGATTIADGADATAGAKADSKVIDPTANASQIALLKGTVDRLNATVAALQQLVTASQDTTPANVAQSGSWAFSTAGQVAATSTASTGTVTSSAVTPTSGTGTFASGTATIPFTSQKGYPVRLVLRGGAAFTAYVGTSTNSCATVNQLTALGSPIAYTGSVDEYVDTPPTTGSVQHCLVLTVTDSGTETYALRN